MQAVLDAMETGVNLPPETDGQEVTVEIAPSVIATMFGCQNSDPDDTLRCTEFYQMPSPVVSAPDGLDIQGLGSAMLQLLGMSPQEAGQLSQSIDWTSTLILPIPQDQDIQVSEMPIDGVTGTERDRLKALEREVRELRKANEILRLASAFFAQAELDRRFKS
jgi:hypothetical protein